MKTLLSLLLLCTVARAATITATSASQVHIQASIAAATHGDTVSVPAGIGLITNALDVTNGITLQGAGIGQTILKDYSVSGGLMHVTASPARASRVTGFTFTNGNHGVTYSSGVIEAVGLANTNTATIRIDNCRFERLLSFNIFAHNMIGVIDHCWFVPESTAIPLYHYQSNWDGYEYGDGSWATNSDWNGTNWLVFESNVVDYDARYAFVDSYRGARIIIRYNTVTNGWVEAHGTESGQRFRGTRAIQVYSNYFVNNIGGFAYFVNLRSGSATVCSNTVEGSHTAAIQMAAYRSIWQFTPWGGANGTNAWDNNAGGGPFETGTHTGANGATILTDGSKSWSLGQWLNNGYTLKNTTADRHSLIYDPSTATTVGYSGAGGYGADMTFNTGDAYKIWKIIESLDQAGVGGPGVLLSGDPPMPVGYPNVDEPVYAWSNTFSASVIGAGTTYIRPGEHFTNYVIRPSFAPMAFPHWLVVTQSVSAATPSRTVLSGDVKISGVEL